MPEFVLAFVCFVRVCVCVCVCMCVFTAFSMAASQVNSAECLQHEDFARLGDQDEDFQAIAYTESKNLSAEYNHACHGMIFARSANILWEKFPKRGCVLVSRSGGKTHFLNSTLKLCILCSFKISRSEHYSFYCLVFRAVRYSH